MLTSGAFGYLADYILWWLLFLSIIIHTWCFFRYFPKERFRKTALVLGNSLVLMCLLATVALFAESRLRFLTDETDSFGTSLPAKRWFRLYTKFNSFGCRDTEWTLQKPEGVTRVAFVGDSFTYGWGIEEPADRFSDRIQREFESREPGRFEVLNVAKPGWGTGDQIQPVRDMIERFQVDEIVLAYVPNDIEKLIPTSEEFDPTEPPTMTFFNPDSSCLVEYLYRRIWLPHIATVAGYHDWLANGIANEGVLREHQQQLHAIIELCREHDVTLRVVILPFLRTGGDKFQANRIHAMLRKFFGVHSVEVLDLFPTISQMDVGELVVNAGDSHPNEYANQLFAEAIWEAFYKESAPQGGD